MSKILIPFIILILSGGIYMALDSIKKEPEKKIIKKETLPVDVMQLKSRDVNLFVETSGTIQPVNEIEISSFVQGQIIFLDKRTAAGGIFRKGEVILGVEDIEYRASIAMVQADLARAKLEHAQVSATADQAHKDWSTLGTGKASALALFKPQLAEAWANVESVEAQLEVARLNLSRTQFIAPFDCKIRKLHIGFGQHIQVGTPLVTLFSIEEAEVRLPLRNEDLAKFAENLLGNTLATGQKIPVEFSATLGGKVRHWQGDIVRSEGMIDPENRQFYVIARIADPYAFKNMRKTILPMGLFVQARIKGKQLKNIISIPQYTLRDENKVLVVDNNNKLVLKSVIPLIQNGEYLLIESGLSPGDQLCLTSLDYVIEGATVKIIEQLVLAGGPDE